MKIRDAVDDLPPDYGVRNGVFETVEVAHWELPDESPKKGDQIEFQSPPFHRLIGTGKLTKDFDSSFNYGFPVNQQVTCLILLARDRDSGRVRRSVFQLSEIDAALIRDLRAAMAITADPPISATIDELRDRSAGPLSSMLLLVTLGRSREPTQFAAKARFALDVIVEGDRRLLRRALEVLASCPEEAISEISEEELTDVAGAIIAGFAPTKSMSSSDYPTLVEAILETGIKHSPALGKKLAGLAQNELSPVIRAAVAKDPSFDQRADAERWILMLDRIDQMAAR
jgi:hypothetical protein